MTRTGLIQIELIPFLFLGFGDLVILMEVVVVEIVWTVDLFDFLDFADWSVVLWLAENA